MSSIARRHAMDVNHIQKFLFFIHVVKLLTVVDFLNSILSHSPVAFVATEIAANMDINISVIWAYKLPRILVGASFFFIQLSIWLFSFGIFHELLSRFRCVALLFWRKVSSLSVHRLCCLVSFC